MPSRPLTVRTLIETYRERLGLEWFAGEEGGERKLLGPDEEASGTSMVGHLNFIHPHRIQVMGYPELEYLEGLGKNSYQDAVRNLFADGCVLVVLAGGLKPSRDLCRYATISGTALVGSPLPSDKLVDHLDYYLSGMLGDTTLMHGVFMDVMGIGVLLTGQSAIGKSELALELITRGHRLVADDAPEFTRVAPDTIRGSCPELLRDFLEVRGLGVLNVRQMFGDNSIKQSKNLRLIIDLIGYHPDEVDSLDRLQGSRHSRKLLDVEVPEIQLPVAPGRNLAVLVEAAVRNHVLYYNGYDAAWDFISRQRQQLEQGD